jgi:ABC-type Na+ efflux pump permease subunit
MMGGYDLGELLLPVRIKLRTPRARRACNLAAFLVVYTACDFVSHIYFDNYAAKGVLAYAVVLLPVLLIFGLIPIYNRYMAEEQDEFQRHLFTQSILWAFLGTLIVVCAVQRLEDYALIFHRHGDFFPFSSAVWVFYFLQLVSRSFRPLLKRDQ